ncbi:DegT/DnrJ/EryC1/StrS family aminotransferase [Desulfosediminicola flagellatus]|uniref:DegT/DnrJ/EryC1/StrS family aminotransferase n=1 Tax=Desulfosediminicola flagellatus TaxID=2569541 RepID=UPI0010AD07AD|nr:DegT/DnrJ/EryC1/StrS family aminotransferase [Desulfosediminicola flagellatus]
MPGFEIFGEEEKKEILEVLDTGVLFRYEFPEQRKGVYKVKEFEEKFANFCGTGFGQAVTSGTAALKVALTAMGVGPGDEVITQGFTFVATWEAILEVGAIPVFTEVDATMNMDPEDLKKKITDKTACIIPVHMLGAQAKVEEIVAIATEKNIPVLEDTAQAAGGHIRGKYLGTFGRCGTFSFDSVKTMTTGEGGMIITDDEELWRTMSEYQDHGHDHKVNPGARGGEGRRFIGSNYRMMELQGAIGIAQLAKLKSMIVAQKITKNRLLEAISEIPGSAPRELVDPEGDTATFCCFSLRDQEHCSRVNEMLRAEGCGAINFAENSWHFYPAWEHLLAGSTPVKSGWPFAEPGGKRRVVYDKEVLPQSADIIGRTLVYPVPIKMDSQRLDDMCAALRKAKTL